MTTIGEFMINYMTNYKSSADEAFEATTLIEDELLLSPMKLLSSIEWAIIETNRLKIWMKTRPISEQQYNILRLLLKYNLAPYFRLPYNDDEIGFWHLNIFSVSIFRNREHEYWATAKELDLKFYAENPISLFDFNGR